MYLGYIFAGREEKYVSALLIITIHGGNTADSSEGDVDDDRRGCQSSGNGDSLLNISDILSPF